MSLAKQGILGKPTTPMLIIAGVKDTQVPISDIYELMNAGDIPKEAWINPSGGHLGPPGQGVARPDHFPASSCYRGSHAIWMCHPFLLPRKNLETNGQIAGSCFTP